ncbi:MAG: formate--tetrahydrofolate ligase [Candidatus Omnitrophica bacterium]|nr:formate--tetrahydrofolate ligase [Candidatus Omnitrophota bacterium]
MAQPQTIRKFPSNIEIAQSARPLQITEIGRVAGLRMEELEVYGPTKAKVSLKALDRIQTRPYGKLILVTAMTPTEAGEGKTSTAIGLTQALGRLRKKVILTLREPSIGPIFGKKGGACGSGYAQVLPMDDINLHFTGDIHAIGTAHNLLCAMVENHCIQGTDLKIHPGRILWRRVSEIPDRNLRHVEVGLGGIGYLKRETGFDITVASEVMAILALSKNFEDLKERLGKILVAESKEGRPVFARDVKAVGAMALLLKDAIKPNIVQTLEGQPVFMHAGPFANMAHGSNSILATEMGLRLADYCVTECGFGTDLGMEKFCDIVARSAGFKPEAAVCVVTVRALKVHGGLSLEEASSREETRALQRGFENLERHLNIIQRFGLVPVVSINRFSSDTPTEIKLVQEHCLGMKVRCALSEVTERGGEGGIELAREVLGALQEKRANFKPLYPLDLPIAAKIETIAREVYGADGVDYVETAAADLQRLTKEGYGGLPVNMAKTQLSFTDNPSLKGAPSGWRLKVREVHPASGAGFLVAMTGKILTMPGLPKEPLAERLDIDSQGRITGLF